MHLVFVLILKKQMKMRKLKKMQMMRKKKILKVVLLVVAQLVWQQAHPSPIHLVFFVKVAVCRWGQVCPTHDCCRCCYFRSTSSCLLLVVGEVVVVIGVLTVVEQVVVLGFPVVVGAAAREDLVVGKVAVCWLARLLWEVVRPVWWE